MNTPPPRLNRHVAATTHPSTHPFSPLPVSFFPLPPAPTGWATNSKVDVARDLFNCLTEFYKTFPDQAKVDLYITGESFAGAPQRQTVAPAGHASADHVVHRLLSPHGDDVRPLASCSPSPPLPTQGHYIPAFGAYIHEQNANGAAVPLKGVSIGDGWTDPILQMTATPALMFNLGLADANQVKVLQDYSKRTEDAIHQGDYKVASGPGRTR